MKLYSASTGGFYSPEIHGENMPADVVEITDELHAELLAAQATGKRIVPGPDGYPVAADQAQPTASEMILAEIAAMEAQITQRRLREALRTSQGAAWLAAQDDAIAVLRAQLT